MEDELIPVAEAAQELGKDKRHVFKVLNRLDIKRSLQTSESARGQKVACISRLDVQRLREYFAESQPSGPEWKSWCSFSFRLRAAFPHRSSGTAWPACD